MRPNIERLLGWPALLLGTILSVGTFLGWFGFHVATPGDTLQNHIVAEQMWKDSAEMVHIGLESLADTIHNDIHLEREEIDNRMVQQQVLLESLVSRSCLRDDYDELVLQRLIPVCESLGIHREPGTPGARSISSDTIG